MRERCFTSETALANYSEGSVILARQCQIKDYRTNIICFLNKRKQCSYVKTAYINHSVVCFRYFLKLCF